MEVRPGDVVLLPSALITHSNLPCADGETRMSFTCYTAGGLHRWNLAGRRSSEHLASDEKRDFEARCAAYMHKGWEAFITFEQRASRHVRSM